MKTNEILFILDILYKENENPYYTTSTDKQKLNEIIKKLENQRNKQFNKRK